ncbi:hypothetical protein QTP86_001942, partial [Hemibagrus guttatus]
MDISSWMTAHQLKLNPSKTELLVIPGDPSPAQDLAISLSNSMISPSATARNLGVTMDNQLSISSHVTNVTRSCRFLLYNIRRIRPFLSTQATQVLVQSLVISGLDYCSSLLAGLPLNAIHPLQMIQNAAAPLVFNLPKFSHTTPLLRSLHWLPVAARIRFKTLMLAYKAKNGPAPSYLKALVTPHTAPRSLRSTSTARLVPPSLREKEQAARELDGELTLTELHEALQGMENGQAPGIDGLPVEFYKAFWAVIGQDVLEVLRDSMNAGQLPLSCRRAVLTLLPKKGDLTHLKNWRPVSLLCTDIKLLSKALASRLTKVMEQITHQDQSYCVP